VQDDIAAEGEPKEWHHPRVFSEEEEALRFYKTSLRPALQRLHDKIAREMKDGTFLHRELE